MNAAAVDDALWSAIGDPTRRQLVDLLLTGGPHTATTLSEHLPVTRQAVTKHLHVLDEVDLIRARSVGRERHVSINSQQLERAVSQLASVGSTWDDRLRRIKRIAETIQRERDS